MTTNGVLRSTSEVLAEVDALLDRVDPNRAGLDPDARLRLVRLARRVRGRVDALTSVVTAEADRARASESAAGTPLASWLGIGETVSRREAAGALRQARRLGQRPLVGEAAVAGRLSASQTRAITGVLNGLAPELDASQQARAEEVLVALAGHLDADQLATSAGQVLRQIVPERANEARERQLQREAEAAQRQRSLCFFHEGASVRFSGSLPRVAAEQWIAQLDASAERTRRTVLERRDPLAELTTPEQRRADALIDLIQASSSGRGEAQAPVAARVLVGLSYDKLADGAAEAGLFGDGQALSAGELRRICCDAELIPVVLGSASRVLDVGRAARLVTPGLRDALIARDGGCAFPGCDAPVSRCEAHHVVPWWAGGATALSNLILLCHHHHGLIEPARFTNRDQWQVRIADDDLPEFIPPARQDPQRSPGRHRRHTRNDGLSPGRAEPPEPSESGWPRRVG